MPRRRLAIVNLAKLGARKLWPLYAVKLDDKVLLVVSQGDKDFAVYIPIHKLSAILEGRTHNIVEFKQGDAPSSVTLRLVERRAVGRAWLI